MEEMTPEMFGAIGLMTLACIVVVTVFQERETIGAWFRALRDRYVTVKPSDTSSVHYDNDAAGVAPAARGHFHASSPEVEAEATPEATPEAGDAFVYINEKALHGRDEETRRRALIEAYARLEAAGYLQPALAARKATAIKRLLFGVGEGRALQRLNAEIEAAKAAAIIPPDLRFDPPAPPPPVEPVVTPIAGRPVAPGIAFPDDAPAAR